MSTKQQAQDIRQDSIDWKAESSVGDMSNLDIQHHENGERRQLDVRTNDRVVVSLLRRDAIDREQIARAQERQRTMDDHTALWRLLTTDSSVDSEMVYAEAAYIYAFPEAQVEEGKPDTAFVRETLEAYSEDQQNRLLELRVIPFGYDLEPMSGIHKLIFISHDPMRPAVQKIMRELDLERFEIRYAPEAAVRGVIERAFPKRNEYLERMSENEMAYDLGMAIEDEDDELLDEEALEDEISSSSLINLFEATLVEAVRMGASDIHIYPNADRETEIHFRIDGQLQCWHVEDRVHPEALLAIVKDNARGVDRFERDKAQDGFIQRQIDDTLIRYRVSILPLASAIPQVAAESIVIRVLDDRKIITDIAQLGLLPNALEKFNNAIRQPHGMVILTGPTGSGKSTTLVAALHQVMEPDVNVLTVEDPVEYIIDGARQIKLGHKLGMDGALRSILRHDPDIVMVGEMRDKPTAELAIKLANTGHLTFSTLHTNDAPSAISRLYKMGIEPFLLAYAINLVVAQRLVRTLCSTCKRVEEDTDVVVLQELGFSEEEIREGTFYRPGENDDCPDCQGRGYSGRRAIAEALYFSSAIRHLIVGAGGDIDEEAVRRTALDEGLMTLRNSAREVVLMGDTSVQELIRVTSSEE
jgi:type IV pilus assembly protein PilB